VLISSKNKTKDSDNNAEVSVKLDDMYFNKPADEMYVCMNQFHTIKSFYACQTGLNDYFQVIYRIPGEDIAIKTIDIYLPEGNYDINTLKKQIQIETNNALFDISYVPRLNKYLYKKKVAVNPNPELENPFEFDVYIKPVNASVFLGFENGVEYKILEEGIYSSKIINLSGYTSMIIKLGGDVNIENTVSNIYDNEYNFDKIMGILNISDVAPMDSILYEDNGSCMFKHKVNNAKISEFSIQIVNEDGVEFPQMSDWILVLKFEKTKAQKDLQEVKDLIEDANFFLASFYSFLNIPSRITLQDLIENR
jgi:hypothetical protein